MHSKKHLSFSVLLQVLGEQVEALPDVRQAGKCLYPLRDVVMSAFACMYFQDASLAQFQKRMEEVQHKNNLRSLFGVEAIPSDSQLRDCLDPVDSEGFAPVFKAYTEALRRHKHLEPYTLSLGEGPGLELCVIDGTQYFRSQKVSCPCCLHKNHRNGEITYSHAVLQGAIMHPDKKQVIPLMPEAIGRDDGRQKQDCEINAAKRFFQRLKKAHPRQSFLIGGDALFSRQPTIEAAREAGLHYLFVAKPTDHGYLMEWLAAYPELPAVELIDAQGRTHRYRWQNQVPLNGRKDALKVNYLDYQLINPKGKVTYRNSWVSDLEVSRDNVALLVKAGRCRWKIENECFNTLKNQGYHLEHNFGHGQQHLSFNMYLLTLLAFFVHQILELTDGLYQACRHKSNSKAYLWECLRGTLRIVVVDSWEQLLELFLNPDGFALISCKKG